MSDKNLPLNHVPPEPSLADLDREKESLSQSQTDQRYQDLPLPDVPKLSTKKTVVIIPSMRIDGGSEQLPWGEPEPILFNDLVNSELEHIEDRGLEGNFGYLWGRLRTETDLLTVLVKAEGLRSEEYKSLKSEYLLDFEGALTGREAVSYEIAKALGCEDLIPPMVSKEGPIQVGEYIKDKIAKNKRISQSEVDGLIGTLYNLQLVVKNKSNVLSDLVQEKGWDGLSKKLKHSLFKLAALDFVLWTHDRPLAGIGYNKDLDKPFVYNLGGSLPHPGYSGEEYMLGRSIGWGREDVPGPQKMERGPLDKLELFNLFSQIPESDRVLCIDIFQQMSNLLEDKKLLLLLTKIMMEHKVPDEAILGFYARLYLLGNKPSEVLDDPFMFLREVVVPSRRGYGFDANQECIAYADQSAKVGGVKARFIDACQEPVRLKNKG